MSVFRSLFAHKNVGIIGVEDKRLPVGNDSIRLDDQRNGPHKETCFSVVEKRQDKVL